MGEGGGGALSQAVGKTGRSIISQSILCNYFKVCTKRVMGGGARVGRETGRVLELKKLILQGL